jgi:hypothetical protein
VVHKVELHADRAVLKIGKFDRVTRASLKKLEACLKGMPYAIGGIECMLADHTLAITLVKRSASDEALYKRLRRANTEASTGRTPVHAELHEEDRQVGELPPWLLLGGAAAPPYPPGFVPMMRFRNLRLA